MKHLLNFVKRSKFLLAVLSPLLKIRAHNRTHFPIDYIISNILNESVTVKVNKIPGKFNIDTRSHILRRILLKKEYEPEIVDIILRNLDPNKDAVNVGANIGLFTNLMASKLNENARVLAIEPTPNAFKLLEQNVVQNNNKNKVVLFNGIATNEPGNYKINIVEGKEEYSSVGNIVHPSVKNQEFRTIEVKGETVDNLVKLNSIIPGIIVIDVEGAESLVLKGSMETLEKYHPIIISELNDDLLKTLNTSSTKVIEILNSLNYTVTDSENNKPKFPFKGNIVAIPKKK